MLLSNRARISVMSALLACGSFAMASESSPETAPSADQAFTLEKPILAAAEAPPKRMSGDAGVTFVTSYISRGIVLENSGLIAQPYADLYFSVYEGSGSVSKVTVFGGIWSSLNSEKTGEEADSNVDMWYEFDWDIGASMDVGKFNFNLMYIEFISPNGGFGTAKNVQFKVSYNDSDSKFPLSPYGLVFFETDGKAGTGSDLGQYFEFGIAPAIPLEKDMKVAFPIYAGFGMNDFYGDKNGNNESIGYLAGGALFSVPIKGLSEQGFGNWTFSVGGYIYWFGDGVRDANDAGTSTDDSIGFLGTMGLGLTF